MLTHYRIVPDRRVENRQVDELLQVLAGMWRPPYKRLDLQHRRMIPPARASWEIVLEHRAASFYLVVPDSWRQVVEQQVAVVWPRATVEPVADPLADLRPRTVLRMELRHHYVFPLRVDRRTQGPLPGLLELTRVLAPGDRVAVQVLLEAAGPHWWEGAATAYDHWKQGRMPKRLRLDGQAVAKAAARAVTAVALDAIYLLDDVVATLTGAEGKPNRVNLDGPSRAEALHALPIGTAVASKLRDSAFDATIRVAVEAADDTTARVVPRAAAAAFGALDGDNGLVPVTEPVRRAWPLMLARRPGLKLNPDLLAAPEVAMLVQLPTGTLQEEYRLEAIRHTETDLPALVTRGGLRMGTATYKGNTLPVYLPTDNLDELCLPHIVIGGMGTGKTRGFAANLAAEAVRSGFCAVVLDPAKGEVGDELTAALPPHQVVRYSFDGRQVYAIDWREVHRAPASQARSRLAAQLCSFVETAAEEAGAQTTRFLRAAAKVVPGGRLSEVVDLLTDRNKAAAMMQRLPPGDDLAMWQTYWDDRATTPARRTQIAMPVLNRLDALLGDTYLEACVNAAQGIDLVALIDQPGRAVVFDIPADLGPESQDVLGAWLATKLQLAMYLRRTAHPVFAIMDEPHQYMRSARYWQRVAVESRKYRFSYCWLFHAWEQIPKDLAAIMQAAGPHYHLYSSSKATFRSLAEEIAPFTVEECLRIPRHHALHVIRAGGQVLPPFLAKMDPPPSMR